MQEKDKSFVGELSQWLDALLVAGAYVVSYYVKKYLFPEGFVGLSEQPNYYFYLLLSVVIFHLCFKYNGFYRSPQNLRFSYIFVQIIKSVLAGTFVFGLFLYLTQGKEYSRALFLVFPVNLFLALSLIKYLEIRLQQSIREKGYSQKGILLIGSKERGRLMVEAVMNSPDRRYKFIGCLEVDKKLVGKTVHPQYGVEIIGSVDEFRTILTGNPIDLIVFAMPLQNIPDIRNSIALAEQLGTDILIMPDWQIHKVMYQTKAATISYDEFVGMPAISLTSAPQDSLELQLKTIMDFSLSTIGLILLSPLLLVIAVLVKITSSGPVLFRQERAGLNGRKFILYKFRTMVEEAETIRPLLSGANEVKGPAFKITNDPRVTTMGRFLRKTSLDELPQLINILRGEMSIVGPRPPIPSEVEQYEFWQRRRLSMKPGLTCIWQVKSRNSSDFKEWMDQDLEYIDNWSLWLDIKLICLTIPALFLGTGR